jgi:hypothetical protein
MFESDLVDSEACIEMLTFVSRAVGDADWACAALTGPS